MATSSTTTTANSGGTGWAQTAYRPWWAQHSSQGAGAHRGLPVLVLWVLTALALMAPLARGGNRHVALMALAWLALAALVGMLWARIGRGQVRPTGLPGHGMVDRAAWGVLLAAPLWLAAWGWLPHAMGWASAPAMPTATQGALLAGLPLVACLAAGCFATPSQAGWLARVWLWGALVQAVWGLLQVAGLDGLRFDAVSNEPAIGSFASKNTYSNLLVMALPLAAWRLGAARQQAGKAARQQGAGTIDLRTWGWALALLVLLATLLLGTSRTGIATGLLALVLAVPLLIWPKASRPGKATAGRRWALVGAAALLGLALLAAGWEWAARFEAGRLLADDATRALMRQTTWQAALAHWPWGSGMGSYASAYMPWQPAPLGGHWIATAHNDYLQMLMELGLALVLLAAAVLWLVGRRLVQGWQQRARPVAGFRQAQPLQRLQTAAGLGLLAIALHAWVDYPFYIPANAMMGCFLLGLWLRPAPAPADVTSRTHA